MAQVDAAIATGNATAANDAYNSTLDSLTQITRLRGELVARLTYLQNHNWDGSTNAEDYDTLTITTTRPTNPDDPPQYRNGPSQYKAGG